MRTNDYLAATSRLFTVLGALSATAAPAVAQGPIVQERALATPALSGSLSIESRGVPTNALTDGTAREVASRPRLRPTLALTPRDTVPGLFAMASVDLLLSGVALMVGGALAADTGSASIDVIGLYLAGSFTLGGGIAFGLAAWHRARSGGFGTGRP